MQYTRGTFAGGQTKLIVFAAAKKHLAGSGQMAPVAPGFGPFPPRVQAASFSERKIWTTTRGDALLPLFVTAVGRAG